MKLSELVAFKNELDRLPTEPAKTFMNQELSKITHLAGSVDTFPTFSQLLNAILQGVNSSFDQFDAAVNTLKEKTKTEIEVAENPWFQESYTLYEQEKLITDADYILNLRKRTDDLKIFRDRINRYADWHYSALIIRPGLEPFVEDMVSFDPLYLVDTRHDFLKPALEKFNKVYQNRLRVSTINEDSDQEILSKIPNGQLGIAVAYQYFNYRPFEVIKQYLQEVYQKLKPGGVFCMTFNDCDRVAAVKLVEQYFCCYTPGSMIRYYGESLGYEIVYSWNDDGPTTWIEFKKPGTLTSIKGGQTLAKILEK